MTIGGVRGKAIKTGGAGGSFSREDLAWLAQNGTLYGDPGAGAAPGLTATGGMISEYADPTGQNWRSHTFTAPGTFDVSAIGAYPAVVDYFVVAGGGGGGGGHGCLLYTSPSPRDLSTSRMPSSA